MQVSLLDTMDAHDYAQARGDRRVLLVYTGGTIGMLPADPENPGKGLRPDEHFLRLRLQEIAASHPGTIPKFEIVQYDPLLDSSDFSPAEWARIARTIETHYYDFDGFVILHGTDTMSYTASALSFMLVNLHKPVVITGSQLPLFSAVSDARSNLVTAMLVAAHEEIPEVCIFFAGRLLRGNRSHKVDAVHPQAFVSPNYAVLGQVGRGFHLNTQACLPQPKGRLRVCTDVNSNIAVLHMIPGFSDVAIRNLCAEPLQGLVLVTYGSGNAPRTGLVEIITEAVAKRGLVVVVVSQCQVGSVDLEAYAAGSYLAAAGAVSGYDMTVECASTKLAWLIGQGIGIGLIKQLMQTNIVGEISSGIPSKGTAFLPASL
jgi:L-asparaginase